MELKTKAQEFLEKEHYMVLCTVNNKNTPESALVAFSSTDNPEVFFSSENWRRKNNNLKHNPAVSIVFGFTGPVTIQYEGSAKLLSKQEAAKYLEKQFAKNPGSKAYHQDPSEKHFLVTPTWIRYSDLSNKPFEIIEQKFSDVS